MQTATTSRRTAASTRSRRCEHCGSARDLRWFTPPRDAHCAQVLLCMACERLTIVPPHVAGTRAPHHGRAA